MADTVKLQTLPLGHLKLGPDFDREFEHQGALVLQLNRIKIKIRFTDSRVILFLAHLRDGIHDKGALHLVMNLASESFFHKLAGCPAGTKPGDLGRWHQFLVCIILVSFNILRGDFHDHVPFTGTRLVYFDIQRKQLVFIFPCLIHDIGRAFSILLGYVVGRDDG